MGLTLRLLKEYNEGHLKAYQNVKLLIAERIAKGENVDVKSIFELLDNLEIATKLTAKQLGL